MPGGVEVVEVGARQCMLSDGVYVAATSGVQVTARSQGLGLGNALFGGTGGFLSFNPAAVASWRSTALVRSFGSMCSRAKTSPLTMAMWWPGM